MSKAILARKVAFLERQIELIASEWEARIMDIGNAGHGQRGELLIVISLKEQELKRLDADLLVNQQALTLNALQASKVPEKPSEQATHVAAKDTIKQFIQRGDLRNALNQLQKDYSSDTVTLIMRRFNENEKAYSINILSNDEYKLEKAQIAYAILIFLTMLD